MSRVTWNARPSYPTQLGNLLYRCVGGRIRLGVNMSTICCACACCISTIVTVVEEWKWRSGLTGVFDTEHRQNRSQIVQNKSRPHCIVHCQVVFDAEHRQNRLQIVPNKSRPHFIVHCQVEDWFNSFRHRPPPKQVTDCYK